MEDTIVTQKVENLLGVLNWDITSRTNITNTFTNINVSCFGGNNGSATASATGGSSPYDYVWTGSSGTIQTDNNISTPSTVTGLAEPDAVILPGLEVTV